MNEIPYIHYGCGLCAPPSWRNFDASPTLRFEKLPVLGKLYSKNGYRFPENIEYGDIVKGLPVKPDSCSGIYASHVLEHLSLAEFRVAIHNTYHILKPGGVFRLVVPDLEAIAKIYLSSHDPKAAEHFVSSTLMGLEERPKKTWDLIKSLFGNSRHLWMWDFRSLEYELGQVGFTEIRRCEVGDAEDLNFKEVEDPARFVDSVGVECRKPLEIREIVAR